MNKENVILDFARNTFWLKHNINERVAKAFNLCAIDVDIITFIYLYGSQSTASSIEKWRNLKKNTISIHVDNLVRLGMIERSGDITDRRAVKLSLTDKAVMVAKKCLSEGENLKNRLIEGLGKDELKIMRQCVKTLNDNAVKLLNRR